jgi:hypothetical protein
MKPINKINLLDDVKFVIYTLMGVFATIIYQDYGWLASALIIIISAVINECFHKIMIDFIDEIFPTSPKVLN